MTPIPCKRRFAGILILCLVSVATAQIPTSFQLPILGYIFESDSRTIRPIAGIAGNSRIDEPLSLPLTVDAALFLPGHRHAVVSSHDSSTAVILDLTTLTTAAIAGAPSFITALKASSNGSAAALYYADLRLLKLVGGLPDTPAILASIDLSFANGPLRQFAIADDGKAALLAFSPATPGLQNPQDSLYVWTEAAGPRYLTAAAHISDIAILADDGTVLDSSSDQVLWIRDIRGDATPLMVANSGNGMAHPVAAAISPRNEVYVGDSEGGILIFDAAGRVTGNIRCNCEITSMAPLANSAIRLSDRTDRPVLIMDANDGGRIFFIPALPPRPPVESDQ